MRRNIMYISICFTSDVTTNTDILFHLSSFNFFNDSHFFFSTAFEASSRHLPKPYSLWLSSVKYMIFISKGLRSTPPKHFFVWSAEKKRSTGNIFEVHNAHGQPIHNRLNLQI